MLGFLWCLIRDALLLLGHLSGGGSFPKPLPRQEEAQALAAMQAGDETARARLIEHNLRLVAHVVRKYTVPGLTQDDLVSVGTLGPMPPAALKTKCSCSCVRPRSAETTYP